MACLIRDRAYAIKRVYKQEPPPKEIFENISAKGGDLLTRTIDNFKPPQNRESLADESDGSGDEERRTPKEEKMDIDDPGSGGGRVTRGATSTCISSRSEDSPV